MKTTFDLPDDLLRRMKMRAIEENKKLKVVAAECMERGMTPSRQQTFVLPKPMKLKGRGPLTIDEIEAAINWGRD